MYLVAQVSLMKKGNARAVNWRQLFRPYSEKKNHNKPFDFFMLLMNITNYFLKYWCAHSANTSSL